MSASFLPLFRIRRVIARLLFLFRRPLPGLVGLFQRAIRFLTGIVGGRFFREELPERPVSEHPNDVTEAGLAQIEHALAAACEAFAAAQASADRTAIAAAGRDLRYWSARRATARVVPAPTDHSEVRFGTSVTIVRDDGREQTFRIVGEDEADPAQGSISQVSPLARAMFGKRVGDVVQAGAGEAEIIRIQ